jgi:hypothetical protein
MIRDPRPAGRAPLVLALIVAGIMLALNAVHRVSAADLELYTSHGWQDEHAARRQGQTYWPEGVVVEINQANAPRDVTALIERMAWSWAERTGLAVTFRGNTESQGAARSGRVTIVWRLLVQTHLLVGSKHPNALCHMLDHLHLLQTFLS